MVFRASVKESAEVRNSHNTPLDRAILLVDLLRLAWPVPAQPPLSGSFKHQITLLAPFAAWCISPRSLVGS